MVRNLALRNCDLFIRLWPPSFVECLTWFLKLVNIRRWYNIVDIAQLISELEIIRRSLVLSISRGAASIYQTLYVRYSVLGCDTYWILLRLRQVYPGHFCYASVSSLVFRFVVLCHIKLHIGFNGISVAVIVNWQIGHGPRLWWISRLLHQIGWTIHVMFGAERQTCILCRCNRE